IRRGGRPAGRGAIAVEQRAVIRDEITDVVGLAGDVHAAVVPALPVAAITPRWTGRTWFAWRSGRAWRAAECFQDVNPCAQVAERGAHRINRDGVTAAGRLQLGDPQRDGTNETPDRLP